MRFNFLYVDRYVFRRGWTYPESYVPYCMLRYILQGSADFIIDGVPHMVQEGEVCYIPEGCQLECHAREDAFSFISIRFTTTVQLDGSDFLAEYFRIPRVTRQADPEVLGYFQQVYQNATTQNTSKLFRIRGNLELILAWLVEHTPEAHLETSSEPEADLSVEGLRRRESRTHALKRDPRVQVVVDYLVAHPAEPFDTEFLACMADMSPSSLRRLFKETTGKSPGAFVKDLRMTTAARRLLVTDERISSIAYELGFDDANYFSRIFKTFFGVSPQEYRAASRE
ncbi:MAG: helix-turn-helix transcriptional regulator [Oscillospiraceae bacterium]|nr:helix-turn-helix transcriptional regulator [Oscillospiraceae bacterium]